MTLPNDVSRCLGSVDRGDGWEVCKKKSLCKRAAAWFNAQDVSPTVSVPVAEYLCFEDPDMSYFIPVDGLK